MSFHRPRRAEKNRQAIAALPPDRAHVALPESLNALARLSSRSTLRTRPADLPLLHEASCPPKGSVPAPRIQSAPRLPTLRAPSTPNATSDEASPLPARPRLRIENDENVRARATHSHSRRLAPGPWFGRPNATRAPLTGPRRNTSRIDIDTASRTAPTAVRHRCEYQRLDKPGSGSAY